METKWNLCYINVQRLNISFIWLQLFKKGSTLAQRHYFIERRTQSKNILEPQSKKGYCIDANKVTKTIDLKNISSGIPLTADLQPMLRNSWTSMKKCRCHLAGLYNCTKFQKGICNWCWCNCHSSLLFKWIGLTHYSDKIKS